MESKGTLPAQPDLDKRLKRLRQLWLPSGLRRPLALAAVAMLSSSLHLAVFLRDDRSYMAARSLASFCPLSQSRSTCAQIPCACERPVASAPHGGTGSV
jgi:hypothetical protein